jgi:NAD(P)-dependent dehydrogenase (short-subunit alcohol dehydrogenase family)
MTKGALIVGAGTGISASFARLLAKEGYKIVLASRDPGKLERLARETGATCCSADASDPASVDGLFTQVDQILPSLDACLFNASARAQGPITEIDPMRARETLLILSYGGFLVAQAAARRMLPKGRGTILLTGASASVKGYPQSAVFAMGKFGLRGLAQSLARELSPKGIHVAHFVIDGSVRNSARGRTETADMAPDSYLDPDAIAQAYLDVMRQHRSAWTWEIELRPWVEHF